MGTYSHAYITLDIWQEHEVFAFGAAVTCVTQYLPMVNCLLMFYSQFWLLRSNRKLLYSSKGSPLGGSVKYLEGHREQECVSGGYRSLCITKCLNNKTPNDNV